MKTTKEQRHEALTRLIHAAIGDSTEAIMSIPPRPDRDADLILAAALDDLDEAEARAGISLPADVPARFDADRRCLRHGETACPSCLTYENADLRRAAASAFSRGQERMRERAADLTGGQDGCAAGLLANSIRALPLEEE